MTVTKALSVIKNYMLKKNLSDEEKNLLGQMMATLEQIMQLNAGEPEMEEVEMEEEPEEGSPGEEEEEKSSKEEGEVASEDAEDRVESGQPDESEASISDAQKTLEGLKSILNKKENKEVKELKKQVSDLTNAVEILVKGFNIEEELKAVKSEPAKPVLKSDSDQRLADALLEAIQKSKQPEEQVAPGNVWGSSSRPQATKNLVGLMNTVFKSGGKK